MTWPVLSSETHPWVPSIPPDFLSARLRALHRGPYSAAVVAPIAAAEPRVGTEVSAALADATAALARFDSEVGALVAPFAVILLRSESASSSQIENLTSGARAIGEAEIGERMDGNAPLIVRNVDAMTAAIALADRLDADAVIRMHAALLGDTQPHLVGGFREQPVWIGGSSYSPHGAAYVAPHHERVPGAMDDLFQFIRRTDVPVLLQAALAHAQFESIHPFPDGNGRTGRALFQSMLRASGVTRQVTVPVSAGLLADTAGYFAALDAYRLGEIEPIAGVFADASSAAVVNGRMLAADIAEVRGIWLERASGLRADAAARRLLDVALARPVLNTATVTAELSVAPNVAIRALDALADRGILRPANTRRRGRVWLADEALLALDAFAARAVRHL